MGLLDTVPALGTSENTSNAVPHRESLSLAPNAFCQIGGLSGGFSSSKRALRWVGLLPAGEGRPQPG